MPRTPALLASLAALLTAQAANAQCFSYYCSDVVIERIYVFPNGPTLLVTSSDQAPLNCTQENGMYLTLDMGQPQSAVMYSFFLAVHLQQKKVMVRIEEGSQGCKIAYAASLPG